MDLKQLIKEYLDQAVVMQVATTMGDQPWACTLHFAYDENFNFYWISTPQRRHSEEIKNNEKVAGVVVLPHVIGQKVRGIQFQGVAREITDATEAREAMSIYQKKLGTPDEKVQSILDGTNGHVVYVIKPASIVLFDTVNFPDSPRQELKL